MRLFRIEAALLLVSLLTGMCVAQRNSSAAPEQTSFSAEDEGMKKPVPVPDSILRLLAADERVRQSMRGSDRPLKSPPQDWFSASMIHLRGPDEQDLLIQARGPLMGANVDTFWVFRGTPTGPVLVMTAAAHDLRIMRRRWKGYRNLELLSATAVECSTTVLRFNGLKYEVYRSKSGPIPHC